MRVVIPSHDEKNIHSFIEQVEKLRPDQIYICNDRDGKGKGWAVRQGLGKGVNIIIDGDGDINPEEILKLLPFINDYDAVIGVKDLKDLPFRRKIVSTLSRVFIKALFRLPVKDSQTGLKIYNNPPNFKTDGFSFDVEMLCKCKRIKEIPIKAKITKQVGVKNIWKTVKELITLWFRL